MTSAAARTWRLSPECTTALEAACIMGILNVTPDSFSDGGAHASVGAAAKAALAMARDGALIIDVGGESTRPGAQRVPVDEQLCRVLPVISALRAASDVAISVDTTRREVAEASLDAGATIINDVSAGLEDSKMLALAAERDCGIVLMHRLAPPEADSYSDRYTIPPHYDDVVADVAAFLAERAGAAMDAGIARESIALDPGLGFGKSVAQNYELIARADELVSLGFPLVCGASRKSFVGKATGEEEPARRVHGSVAAALAMFSRGVRIFRVHDVSAHREALAVAETILRAQRLVSQNPESSRRTPV